MADEPQVTQTPLANDPSSRTETGEIKDSTTKIGSSPAESIGSKTSETKSEGKAGETKPLEGAPEKYEFKTPEGYEVDPGAMADASAMFKKHNLTQAQAQELMDVYTKHSVDSADAPYKQYATMREGWRNEMIKDNGLGNGADGLKPEVQANVAKLIDSLGQGPAAAFREAMDLTGAGDHPAFIRAMNDLGRRFGEGTHVSGKGPTEPTRPNGAKPTAAQALWPTLPSGS